MRYLREYIFLKSLVFFHQGEILQDITSHCFSASPTDKCQGAKAVQKKGQNNNPHSKETINHPANQLSPGHTNMKRVKKLSKGGTWNTQLS